MRFVPHRILLHCATSSRLSVALSYSGATVTEYAFVLPPVIGLGLLTWAAVRLFPFLRARHWKETTAILELLEEECSDAVIGYETVRYCSPVVTYSYVVAGCEYRGTRASFETRNVWRADTAERRTEPPPEWVGWKIGASIPVFYNPARPEESVLVPSLSQGLRSHYAAIIAGGLLCAVLGGFLASTKDAVRH